MMITARLRLTPATVALARAEMTDRAEFARLLSVTVPEELPAGGQTRMYHSATRAWSDDDLTDLLSDAGFSRTAPCDQWRCNTDALRLWVARVE